MVGVPRYAFCNPAEVNRNNTQESKMGQSVNRIALLPSMMAANDNPVGSIAFIGNGSLLVTDPTNFFYDSVNVRLGIGKNNPATALDVAGTITATALSLSAGITGTTFDGLTITTTTGTFTLANGKTLTVNNSLTLAGTDGTTMTFPTTSATIARTDAANTFTGHQTIEGVTSTGATGTGNLVFSVGPTLTGASFAAGTATVASSTVLAGVLLTTAAAGAEEYDGVCFYDTAVASSRQVRTTEQFVCLTANGPTDNNSLLDSATAAAVFRTPTNGTITLAAATSYFFEASYKLSNTGTTSHTWSTLFAGTATLTSIQYDVSAYTGTTSGATITALSGLQVGVATATAITAASTSATEFVTVKLRGIIRVNAAGTLIPQMQASARPGATGTPAVIILAGSYFRIWPVGSNTVGSVGNWS